ncbi:MAG: type II toxin-antitoxin system PemK/MazF family toxin [Propionibacteriaceae bacterium]|jgi:mRNA interferase MazF|nr:type II toxin-antitoxin system PemK/MazF family toxin [Propionibacteriaceae bacterium]
MSSLEPLTTGTVAWAQLDPVLGKEYTGHRPVLVISSEDYLSLVTDLVIVLPITTIDRGWPNHIPVSPTHLLPEPSWIVTEQPRTISRARISKIAGRVDPPTLASVHRWLDIFWRPQR